jgi:hypothetical protein
MAQDSVGTTSDRELEKARLFSAYPDSFDLDSSRGVDERLDCNLGCVFAVVKKSFGIIAVVLNDISDLGDGMTQTVACVSSESRTFSAACSSAL